MSKITRKVIPFLFDMTHAPRNHVASSLACGESIKQLSAFVLQGNPVCLELTNVRDKSLALVGDGLQLLLERINVSGPVLAALEV
jgi:hypothetical protein